MSVRLQVSQNIGPHVFTSLENVRQSETSPVFLTDTYTVHSYQVITTNIKPNTNVAFKILATNDLSLGWQTIAQYNIKGTAVSNGPVNNNGILYCDFWNFKHAKCKFEGSFTGAESFKVLEKHNA